ncbi:MAG: hypothetical protein HDR31_02310 [Mycoplasma sp.]|nr:hypothetical protein [Mycoplasma sp.]
MKKLITSRQYDIEMKEVYLFGSDKNNITKYSVQIPSFLFKIILNKKMVLIM